MYLQRGGCDHEDRFAVLNRVRHFRAHEVDHLFQHLADLQDALDNAADSYCDDTVMLAIIVTAAVMPARPPRCL